MAKWKEELDALSVPKHIHQRAKVGVQQVKKPRRPMWWKIGALVAALCVIIGVTQFFKEKPTVAPVDQPQTTTAENGSIHIPAISIPDDASSADMIGLVVYNGHIYTQSDVTYSGPLRALQGERIGVTKDLIDEWSNATAYEKQLASNIGEQPIYRVKGYDSDFRMMYYSDLDGDKTVEIMERLNDITIASGADVFSRFHVKDNVVSATWQSHTEWNASSKTVHLVKDVAAMERFVTALYEAPPHKRDEDEPLSMDQNDQSFKSLTIKLKDGTAMTFKLLKGGYVYYGFMDVYFEMDEDVFNDIWQLLA